MAGRKSMSSKDVRRVVASVWAAYNVAAGRPVSFTVAPCLWCGEDADRTLAAHKAGRGEAGHFTPNSKVECFCVECLHPSCRVCNLDAGDTDPRTLWTPAYTPPASVPMLPSKVVEAARDTEDYDTEADRRRALRRPA